jgi:hypothetical protein
VVEGGGDARLDLEALPEGGLVGELGEEELDRDVALEAAIPAQPHLAHASEADLLAQLVPFQQDARI